MLHSLKLRRKDAWIATPLVAAALVTSGTLCAPAAQADQTWRNGNYTVQVEILNFSFPFLNDCGFAGGQNCRTSQVWGNFKTERLRQTPGPQFNEWDKVGDHDYDGSHDVVQGVAYEPVHFFEDIRTYPNDVPWGKMTVTADSQDVVRVTADFVDDDQTSGPDSLCTGNWSASAFTLKDVMNATPQSGSSTDYPWRMERTTTTYGNGSGNDDGACTFTYRVTVQTRGLQD
ncbi:hypothetical protein [Streptomyces sp. NPDC047028]|uniref:hypothetical protein n=1 Tax=Streptomyces sp. NPDC047028 TaxID=3155793 RepID=UPI003411D03B